MAKSYKFTVVLSPQDDGGYLVEVPILPGCATYGKTVDEALEMVREAIASYLGSLIADGEEIPQEGPTDCERVMPRMRAPHLARRVSVPGPEPVLA